MNDLDRSIGSGRVNQVVDINPKNVRKAGEFILDACRSLAWIPEGSAIHGGPSPTYFALGSSLRSKFLGLNRKITRRS
jgi:hypothetical protein